MRKFSIIAVLLLATSFVMASASLSLADDDMTGRWAGTWTCVATPDKSCDKPGGTMEGNFTQQGTTVTADITMRGTAQGDISGHMDNGVLVGGQFSGFINCADVDISVTGTLKDQGTLEGSFTAEEMGGGTFSINRQ